MVAKDEYLKALDIVIEYHEQLKKDAQIEKTTISEFIEKCNPSVRLINCLKNLGELNDKKEYVEPFIEDINFIDMLDQRMIGLLTIREFTELKKKYKERIKPL